MSVQAMKAGAVEFLTKPFKDDVLLDAIRVAIERSRAARLNKQVGGELGISEITVKAHRGQVMRTMKARSLPDLVTMAARLGLGSAPKH
jgi:FixJ family two-component response regulator